MSTAFTDLHAAGTFLLVNVHDAGAAAIAQAAGAVALGTTSSGHAYTLARKDGVGAISRQESMDRAEAICAAVDIPVSIDAENGWGHQPEQVAATIIELAERGAAGASIEDWSSDVALGFYDESLAVARIEAAVDAARSLPEPFVICARAEAFLYGDPDPLRTAITRLQRFAEVGADCLYAPGPRDLATFGQIAAEAGGPTNALVGVGSELTMADMAQVGVRRVSVGGSLYRAAMAAFHQQVAHMVSTGNFSSNPAPLPTALIESFFDRS